MNRNLDQGAGQRKHLGSNEEKQAGNNGHPPQRNRLQGKVTLIINGVSESGRILAKSLAQKGSDIVILYFNDADTLANQIQSQVEAAGQRCLILKGNPESQEMPREAIEKIQNKFGRLDIFISYSPDTAADYSLTKEDALPTEASASSSSLFPHLSYMKAAMDEMVDQSH